MLKRLELVGFKSFADKTRFDFAPGITGVVGPNGSGKSNVVDAVRWMLGEQSAKSLRGGEMADVIFNGSSSRKSLGLAEVTVAFDNTRRLLAVDADEVQLTRRVYRDGTGEYLVNGQMARLKDFKEIFLGSGAGTGGYTIIAQGRVDELLQASTRDRREIFDEAAGISRFKAKKKETLAKLAHVELNLTRSRDRLEGLDAQLRTLRMQAAKAQKFKEHSDRLRELRLGLGVREYREFTAALERDQQVLASVQAEVSGANQRTGELEAALRDLDREVTRGEDGLRHQETRLADARQQIAGFESTIKHERAAAAGYEAERLTVGRQRAELGHRTRALEADAARSAAEAAAADERLAQEQAAATAAAGALADAVQRADDLDAEVAASHKRQMDLVRESAAAESAAGVTLGQVERLQKDYTRKLAEIEQNTARRGTLAAALDGLSRADADVQQRLGDARDRLASVRTGRAVLAERVGSVQAALESLRVRQGDLRGRLGVLEDLERSLDGLGAGVRAVFNRLGELPEVAGLVADLLTVPHEIAPLVELALGDAAQRFVVRSAASVDTVVAAVGDVPGRVGFVPLLASVHSFRPSPLAGEGGEALRAGRGGSEAHGEGASPGTAAVSAALLHLRAAGETPAVPGKRVQEPAHDGSRPPLAAWVASELSALPDQLLGNVLIADSLAGARHLAAANPGYRVVSRTGELLELDGTLTVGPPRAEAGLVSRKSELRELREQFRALAAKVEVTEVELADLRRQADAADGVIAAIESEIELLSGAAGDLLQKIARQRQEVENLDELIGLAGTEAAYLEAEVRRGEAAWVAAKQQAEESAQATRDIESRLVELKAAQRAAEEARDDAQHADTAAQVALGRATADRDRARERAAQFEADLRKRRIEAIDLAAADRNARSRLTDSTLAALRATAGQADAYREKEHRERLAGELAAKLAVDRAARERVRDELQALRSGWQAKQSQAHAKELAVQTLLARRDAVAARIREDYGVELSELASGGRESPGEVPNQPGDSRPPLASEPTPAEVTAEIDDLRKKLTRLGSVNMEALDELVRVETEHGALKAQHEDLAAARKSLQDVIDAINGDSQKLFTETLAAVRGYFQELFRKVFGGGQADIILEDPSDVLESGIEITARPPGKELRSLSLLSGGEKTMTAIALLLAIFRNKPSPFCILDEVDAALDEANTQRLASVLREFLDRSQFIVITHKKRTMAAADRLWGVTMQESGISRILPMRFEDWPDDEHQAAAA
ncbi:chromosome segregation protein smc : Chromosome partition protein Smc OS=Blastopirellula marina DSM 3645 GN=smc PE=3 SV=1: SMC_N: SMC_hinge [Gemmataceae bacterium]|nr:chromosome segregation protein smc : Chromosome partition protein Smc OS=Blastopirellula marina DSM 3645 GN=smc PE=3 SV=1: SMC_N: SMC_hinge [Gemmataceae bacterium]VTT98162.1 chromosome segregation protein smc : Chromosome partition protein Smc OS=Blastopirellula marina DSM 3645 GN=smc PE=3 SV=1: SMC_N: SMC_hinge [Gemmataceae bacterium]